MAVTKYGRIIPKVFNANTWIFLSERIYRFARWWKVNYFLIEVSITEPQGSSITDNVTQSITAHSELIA
jgi:hypothetical protein